MSNDSLTKAIGYFNEKNYEKALSLFLELSESDQVAQYYLGAIYRMGLGIKEDQKEAFKWFLKAAEQGHVQSQYLVGCAYEPNCFISDNDDIVYDDYERFIEIAEKDQSTWQDSIPYFDLNGRGVEPDTDEAMKWFLKASNQGYDRAAVAIGDLYQWGLNGVTDKEESIKWYSKAAIHNNVEVTYILAMSSEFYEKNHENTIELYTKAYHLGSQRAAYMLARFYEKSKQIEDHYQEAFKWYKIAAEQFDDIDAQVKLGDLYQHGIGIEKDTDLAIKWYLNSIETYRRKRHYGYNEKACKQLYSLYQHGHLEMIKESQMIDMLIEAAENDDDWAKTTLIDYYHKGYQVSEKLKKEFDTFEKANLGDKKAQLEYGYKYIVNRSVNDKIKTLAFDWYIDDAVNHGNPDAQYLLSQTHSYPQYQLHWLKKAAEQNHPQALYELALKYREDNPMESLKYMRLASESYVYAQIDLGYDYAHGNIVEKDYFEAYKLYQKAASSMQLIKDIHELRVLNYIKLRYNAGNDKAEASALNKDVEAQLYMGCLYQYGFEIKRNAQKAVYWYKMAAHQGNKEAQAQLDLLNKDEE